MSRPHRAQSGLEIPGLPPRRDVTDISMLVLITPSEAKTSGANLEFEDPFPSDS